MTNVSAGEGEASKASKKRSKNKFKISLDLEKDVKPAQETDDLKENDGPPKKKKKSKNSKTEEQEVATTTQISNSPEDKSASKKRKKSKKENLEQKIPISENSPDNDSPPKKKKKSKKEKHQEPDKAGMVSDSSDKTGQPSANQLPSHSETNQVWSQTQFYSVDFSQSKISVKACVFYKRTIKVCVSCC